DDVHALGVLWYQLLLGDLRAPLSRDYRDDLAELGLCDELIAALAGCVAGKAEKRWRDAAELSRRLEELPADLLKCAGKPPAVVPPPEYEGTLLKTDLRVLKDYHAKALHPFHDPLSWVAVVLVLTLYLLPLGAIILVARWRYYRNRVKSSVEGIVAAFPGAV